MKNKKFIAFIIGGLRSGGAEKVCIALINEFHIRGYKVGLIVLNLHDEKLLKQLDKDIAFQNLDKLHTRAATFHLYKVLKKWKVDICLSFNFQLSVQLILLKKLLGLKYIIYSRGINTFSQKISKEKSFRHKYFNAFIIKRLYNKSDYFIAQSTGMKKDMILSLSIPEDKIRIIFNPLFSFECTNMEYLGDGLKNEKKEILFVGSLKNQKNIPFLLESIRELLNYRCDFIFRIVGEGSLRMDLEGQMRLLELENYVSFEGFSHETYNYYKKADVFILGSWYEGFPNVLVEALSYGVPVVSIDCMSGPSDIIAENVNGYLVDGYDKTLFASKINQALNKEWNVKLILQSIQKFNFDKIYNQYEQYLTHEESN